MVELPVGVEDWVEIVRAVEQLGVQDTEENDDVAPVGRPAVEKLREAGVPVVRLAVIVLIAVFPWVTDIFPLLVSEKLNATGAAIENDIV